MRFITLLLLVLPLALPAFATSCVTTPGHPCPGNNRDVCCPKVEALIDSLSTSFTTFTSEVQTQVNVLNGKLLSLSRSVSRLEKPLMIGLKREGEVRSRKDKSLSRSLARVAKALTVETTYRIGNDTKVLAAIKQESTRRSRADKVLSARVSTLSKQFHGEIEACKSDEELLKVKIEQETIYRIKNDTALKTEIGQMSHDLQSAIHHRKHDDELLLKEFHREVELRSRKDRSISRSIAKVFKALEIETTQRISHDNEIRQAIKVESTRRSHGDKSLQGHVHRLGEAVKHEMSTRKSRDAKLSHKVHEEISLRKLHDMQMRHEIHVVNVTILEEIEQRTAGDAKLQHSLDSEAGSRKKIDAGFEERITALSLARCDPFTTVFLRQNFTAAVTFPAVNGTRYAPALSCYWRVLAGALPTCEKTKSHKSHSCHGNKPCQPTTTARHCMHGRCAETSTCTPTYIFARPQTISLQDANDYVEIFDELTGKSLVKFTNAAAPATTYKLGTSDAFLVRFVSAAHTPTCQPGGFNLQFWLGPDA